MCGIIGYTGSKDASGVLLAGLERLEYRGYDSAGLAVVNGSGVDVVRSVGRVADLARLPLPRGFVGIGHTRWATHGAPSTANAHPHASCRSDVTVVHNGIIENHVSLRDELEARGHVFTSETDTEVLAHLVEDAYHGNFLDAVRAALERVEGSYAIGVVSNRDPGTVIGARNRSPLLVGVAEEGTFLSSDVTAILEHTRRVVYLVDGEIAVLRPGGFQVFDAHGKPQDVHVDEVQWSVEEAEKGGFPHFMLKEIHQIPHALMNAFRHRLSRLPERLPIEGDLSSAEIAQAERFRILACGTSYHAGLIGQHVLTQFAGVPVDVHVASEYRYAARNAGDGTIAVGISQSGETADSLGALQKAKDEGARTLAITNVTGSAMQREADGVLQMRAGPEIGVAATKTFTNTLAVLYLIAIHVGVMRGHLMPSESRRLVNDLKTLPRITQQVLDHAGDVKHHAETTLSEDRSTFFLGRQLAHGLALEGALKMKEIAYVHAEGYAAGELKHGPLALLEPGAPVIACTPQDHTHGVMMGNLREVRTRGARVLAVADAADPDVTREADAVIRLPSVDPVLYPFPATVALNLLSYYPAAARGLDIDKPRNLAKSVTVE